MRGLEGHIVGSDLVRTQTERVFARVVGVQDPEHGESEEDAAPAVAGAG